MLAPIVALTITVAIATGEVRYRIPFDIFFIVIVCAYVVGDFARADGHANMRADPASRAGARRPGQPAAVGRLVYACGHRGCG